MTTRSAAAKLLSTLEAESFSQKHFMTCLFLAVLCYASLIALPAYNADDVIQGQPVSGDGNTFLAQGRWGYYLVFNLVLGSNPLGPFGLSLGIVILLSASILAARTMGLTSALTVSVFALLSTVSLFYSSVFTFDSTRIAYPLAVLLAVAGVHMALSQDLVWRGLGTLMLGLAPAFFSASAQVAATLIFLMIMLRALRRESAGLARDTFNAVAALGLGLVLYAVSMRILPILTDIPLGGRVSIDILAALASYDRFIHIITDYALPVSNALHGNAAVRVSGYLLYAAAIVSIVIWFRPESRWGWCIVFLAGVGILVAPFWLAFLSPLDQFGPRALLAYATTHAGLAAIALQLIPDRRIWIRAGVVASASLLLLGSAVGTSRIATDEYLTSRNDVLATSRLISEIDRVVAESELPAAGPIPLAVRYTTAMNMAPRGPHSTARQIPWARGWIFRQVDPRFVPLAGEIYHQLVDVSADRPIWPQRGSIYIDDGVVVVNVN